MLEEELIDTRGGIEASLINFTFEKPVEIQFLKFELVSYWGEVGGGLQYFAPIPSTSKASSRQLEKSFGNQSDLIYFDNLLFSYGMIQMSN